MHKLSDLSIGTVVWDHSNDEPAVYGGQLRDGTPLITFANGITACAMKDELFEVLS